MFLFLNLPLHNRSNYIGIAGLAYAVQWITSIRRRSWTLDSHSVNHKIKNN